MSSKGSSSEGSNIPDLEFSRLSLEEANLKLEALMEKGRFHEAVNECLSILENDPQDEYTKMVLSTVYMRFGEIEKARVLLMSIENQKPGSLPSLLTKRLDEVSQHMKKAESAYNEKKWDMVLTHTEAAKEEADMCIKLYLYRAEASLHLELVKEAISEVLSALVSLHKKNGEET